MVGYEIIEELSSGMFDVYELKEGRQRVIHKAVSKSTKYIRDILKNEVAMLQRASKIEGVLSPEVICSDNKTFVIMEKVGDINLDDLFARRSVNGEKIDLNFRLSALSSGLDSVESLNEAGLYHGDLKPDNLRYGFSSKLTYLIDFELCRSAPDLQKLFDFRTKGIRDSLTLDEAKHYIAYSTWYLSPLKAKHLMIGDYENVADMCEGYSSAMLLTQAVLSKPSKVFELSYGVSENLDNIEKRSSQSIKEVVQRALNNGGIEVASVNNAIKEYLNN